MKPSDLARREEDHSAQPIVQQPAGGPQQPHGQDSGQQTLDHSLAQVGGADEGVGRPHQFLDLDDPRAGGHGQLDGVGNDEHRRHENDQPDHQAGHAETEGPAFQGVDPALVEQGFGNFGPDGDLIPDGADRFGLRASGVRVRW